MLLTEKKEIENFLQSKLKSDQIAVDIEFMRRNTFFPEPCVIQISDGKNHACIDLTLDLNYKKIFQEIFCENKIIIMHSCRQDLEILKLILGYIPKSIFDTQFAASFLGYKYQIGYAEIIKLIFGVDIDKTEKMTNWKKRPLTSKQISYALNDVIYLNRLYSNLYDELKNTNKLEYFYEEFNSYIEDIKLDPSTENAWKKIKSINKLNPKAKNIAKIISTWRERKAIELNLPRNWILLEKDIIELSKKFNEKNIINFPIKESSLNIEKFSIEIEDEIKNASLDKNSETKKNKIDKQQGQYKKVVDELYEYYKNISIKNKISYQIFSPKKMILNYVKNPNKKSKLINGWRKKLIDTKKISVILKSLSN